MTIDIPDKSSSFDDDESQILLKDFLTTFLTTTLNTRSSSFLKSCQELILFLFNARGNEGYAKQICDHYNHPHKHYAYVVNKLEKAGLILVLPQKSNYVPIILNASLVNVLNKILGGVANQRLFTPHSPQQDFPLSENGFPVREHRIMLILEHNLSSRRFLKLRGKWSHHHSRCTSDEFSDNLSDNSRYVVQWFKDKCLVFPPAEFGVDNFRMFMDKVSFKIARFAVSLEKKYRCNLELLHIVKLDRSHSIKYEIESQDPLSLRIAELLKNQGYSQHEHTDWKMNDKYDGIEYIQGYKNRSTGREGNGPELFNNLLYFPERFQQFEQQYISGNQQLIQKVENLETKQDLGDKEKLRTWNQLTTAMQQSTTVLEKVGTVLENLSIHTFENLATKTDVESVRENVQSANKVVLRQLSKILISHGIRCDQVQEKLLAGPMTLTSLARAMNLTKSAVLRYTSRLLKAGIIESDDMPSGKRGRPQKIYKLQEDSNA